MLGAHAARISATGANLIYLQYLYAVQQQMFSERLTVSLKPAKGKRQAQHKSKLNKATSTKTLIQHSIIKHTQRLKHPCK